MGGHGGAWEERLAGVGLGLVIDVGGGTTDFSLVRIDHTGDRLALERLAVGDHILLGGDNIDVALARRLEPQPGEKLDNQRWQALTTLCRPANEALVDAAAPARAPVRLPPPARHGIRRLRAP